MDVNKSYLFVNNIKLFVNCLKLNRLTTYFDVKYSTELFAYLGYNNYFDESQLSAFDGLKHFSLYILLDYSH